jgi:hypothetical protein
MGTEVMTARVMVRVEGAGRDGYMVSGWARSGVQVKSWDGADWAQHFHGRVRGHSRLVGYAEPTLMLSIGVL